MQFNDNQLSAIANALRVAAEQYDLIVGCSHGNSCRPIHRACDPSPWEFAAMTHKLFGGTIHSALVHAATEYDRRLELAAAKRKHGYFNHYALSHYLEAIADAEAAIVKGATVRAALLGCFNGRLLDVLLKAVGEPKFTREEMLSQSYTRVQP
jgi:hypothetical protein